MRFLCRRLGPPAMLVLVLALPATALAEPEAPADRFELGPVNVHGYKLWVEAPTGSAFGPEVSVTLIKRRGRATETHEFRPLRADVRIAAALSGGSIRVPGGRLSMNGSFHPRGPEQTLPLPEGCAIGDNYPERRQPGVFTGSLRLVADHGRYFGTIRRQSIPGYAASGPFMPSGCDTPPGGSGPVLEPDPAEVAVTGGLDDGRRGLSLWASQVRAPLGLGLTYHEGGRAGVSIMHTIQLPLRAYRFRYRSDISWASMDVHHAWAHGRMTFTGRGCPPSYDNRQRAGTLSGRIVARFDSVGTRTFFRARRTPGTLDIEPGRGAPGYDSGGLPPTGCPPPPSP